MLIALGDSVTAGHNGGKDSPVNLVCDDRDYAYPRYLFDALKFADGLKKAEDRKWVDDGQYVNLAHSGFGTDLVLAGGTNGCDAKFASPVNDAVALLKARQGLGNRVVMTVGINNTNWVELLTGVATAAFLADRNNATVDATTCENWMLNGVLGVKGWTGRDEKVRAGIKDGLIKILDELVAADPDVQISVVGYYNMARTGWTPIDVQRPFGPAMPAACKNPVTDRLDLLSKAQTDAIAGSKAAGKTKFVAVASMNNDNRHVQQLDFDVKANPTTIGWPHPNRTGHQKIAAAL